MIKLKQHNQQKRRQQIKVKSKSWCLVPVTASKSGLFTSTFHKNQKPFCTSSENNLTKIHFRNFKNIKELLIFFYELKIRFKKRFNKKIKARINLRGTKLEYYVSEKQHD